MSDPHADTKKALKESQMKEAELNWKRSGFFLLTSSILLLAMSRIPDETLIISFAVLGIFLNLIWLGIQHSSEYIKNYKNQIKALTQGGTTHYFSKDVGGYEMRKLALLLPFPFIMIWVIVLLQNLV
ncbi:MAG: hypothetical protein J4F36_14430 [Nitrosopumilaceae archaeon]|nr:hypothetical protein [Nitrosopumilaceae archaeon]